jgi:activator of HSP90 ATPase
MGTVKKIYRIAAPPGVVFDALTDTAHVRGWSGDEAKMNGQTGSRFSLWNGSIFGINIEVTPKRIIQDWKENTWDKFSKVTIYLHEKDDHTELELIHEQIPDGSVASIDNGWDDYYLRPLKMYVEEKLAS